VLRAELLFMNVLKAAAIVTLASATLVAQDAITTLPDNYKLQFENAWVKVTRVHYPAHAKVPAHTHTALACAYVYLNDSGPVVFKHVGAEYGAITRPPVKAGSFRLFRGVDEIHEVENLSAEPSHFLRVEFKTDPVEPRTLRGKFASDGSGHAVSHTVQFENAQIRVTRAFAPAGKGIVFVASTFPSLVVLLARPTAGDVSWLPEGIESGFVAGTVGSVEALRFELKTNPQSQ
jgi:hypothetical protein